MAKITDELLLDKYNETALAHGDGSRASFNCGFRMGVAYAEKLETEYALALEELKAKVANARIECSIYSGTPEIDKIRNMLR